jgi:3-deoxy-D-manno-octulosonic-acid transferase
LLAGAGLPFAARSGLDREGRTGPAAPGSVVLWDRFGELGAAYGLAKAAFVGGSLRPLGGQNFLEPLSAGVMPVIGPHWTNFAWVGQEIVDEGLIRVAATPAEVAELMAQALARPADRAGVRRKADKYLSERSGGTLQACQLIMEQLQGVRPKP